MTDRSIWFTTSQVRSKDLLQSDKNAMIGDGAVAHALAGTYSGLPVTAFKGFAAAATNPTTMTINIGPGEMFAPAVVDTTPYSTLGTDTTHNITKIGINLDTVIFTFSAPSTAGTTQIFLIQAQLQTVDTGDSILQYFDSENPGTVFNGPNNTGLAQATQRQDICAFSVVAGNPSSSPVAPTASTGWTGLYLVTVPSTVTAITQSMITRVSGTHFIDKTLVDLQDYFPTIPSGIPGTVTAVTAGTGLNGGTITSTGTISLANTGVSAGSYTNTNLTVDQFGRITSASNGSAGSSGGGTVTSVVAGGGLLGGTITSSGTISMPTSSASGTYANANITVDGYGRVVAASNGTSGGGGVSQTAIDNLQNQINTLTTNLGTNTTHDGVQDTEISALQGQVSTLNSEYTSLNTQLGVVQGQIVVINNLLNNPQKIRYRLSQSLTINVATTGNDNVAAAAISGSNPTPSSTPFATLQRAWNTIVNSYDLSGQTLTFNVAPGTYASGLVASGITGLTDTGSVNIIGSVNNPGNTVINTTQGVCFGFDNGIRVKLAGFKLRATQFPNDPNTGVGIAATQSTVEFDAIEFSDCDTNHIMVFAGGDVHAKVGSGDHSDPNAKGYLVSGHALVAHMNVQPRGGAGSVKASVTINPGVFCGVAWYLAKNGVISTYQTEFNGTQYAAVGPRYSVTANGVLDNGGINPNVGPNGGNGQILPGNSDGTADYGGQVISI